MAMVQATNSRRPARLFFMGVFESRTFRWHRSTLFSRTLVVARERREAPPRRVDRPFSDYLRRAIDVGEARRTGQFSARPEVLDGVGNHPSSESASGEGWRRSLILGGLADDPRRVASRWSASSPPCGRRVAGTTKWFSRYLTRHVRCSSTACSTVAMSTFLAELGPSRFSAERESLDATRCCGASTGRGSRCRRRR